MIFWKRPPRTSYPISDHFDGRRFFVADHAGDKSSLDMLKWTFTEKRAQWPKHFHSPYVYAESFNGTGIRSTLIGHASFLLKIHGVTILIDPVFSNRASPLPFAGPKRVNPPAIALKDLTSVDAVLLTHNHYDHMDKASLWAIEKRWQPLFVGPLGIEYDLRRKGKLPNRFVTMDWSHEHNLGPVHFHAVPTYHWSARGLRDRHKSLWCSFVISSPSGVVYHIGDTGYGAGQFSKDVKQKFPTIDLAHIPIGAYEPRWFMKDHHVNPAEAVQIFQDCGAQAAIGHHWGTFQLTNEGHLSPPQDLEAALTDAAIPLEQFQAFRPGQVWQKM
jgi:L-ascorbate metabolism protein UlaG (beta-lactamase superfamily)